MKDCPPGMDYHPDVPLSRLRRFPGKNLPLAWCKRATLQRARLRREHGEFLSGNRLGEWNALSARGSRYENLFIASYTKSAAESAATALGE